MPQRQTPEDWIRAHGGEGILNDQDVPALTAASLRVLDIVRDLNWHSADEIRTVAGNGTPASEGLRRWRDLKPYLAACGFTTEKRRIKGSRLFEYRIVQGPRVTDPANPPRQTNLFEKGPDYV